jgi:hypothetical protein
MQLMAFKKSRSSCKKSWSPQEDQLLNELVKEFGTSSWTKIAEGLTTRTGKQCRERYHNHLQPNIRKGDWTEEEDRIIVEMQQKLGNQWAKITKMLPGRTDNAVKNRWHAAMRSQGRMVSTDSIQKPRQPRVPMLALDKAGVSSAGSSRIILNEDDYENLFGGSDTDGESSDDNHHAMHDHTDSARTESVTNSARSMSDDTNGNCDDSEYSTFSPRLSEFLCFPISSSAPTVPELPLHGVSAATTGSSPCDLLAADASPREVQSWLSASPRDKESTFVFGAYITSPGKHATSRCFSTTTSTTSCSSSSRRSRGAASKTDARRKRANIDSATSSDSQLFASLRTTTQTQPPFLSATGDLSDLSHESGHMTDADMWSSDSSDDDSDFAFPDFDKIEISPRWEMSPRGTSSGVEMKRRCFNSTPLHMKEGFFDVEQDENNFSQPSDQDEMLSVAGALLDEF